MARTPSLHRIVIDSKKSLEENLRNIQQHQDRVRLALAEPRTHLREVPPAKEPVPGELMFQKGTVQVAVAKGAGVEYQQVYPPVLGDKLTNIGEGIPQWLLDRIKVREDELRASGIPESEWKYYGGL